MEKAVRDRIPAPTGPIAVPSKHQIGVRVGPQLKKQIEEAATASGRSLAQETEMRIAESFEIGALFHDARTKAFMIELAAQIARAEAATEKSWTDDGATYWAARKLMEDAIRRAAPTPPNYAEVNEARSELIELTTRVQALAETLQKCGALSYPNALAVAVGEASVLRELPRERWHMPERPDDALDDEEAELIEEWLAEWRDLNGRISALAKRHDELLEPIRIAKASGAALHKHLIGEPDAREE